MGSTVFAALPHLYNLPDDDECIASFNPATPRPLLPGVYLSFTHLRRYGSHLPPLLLLESLPALGDTV